MRAGSVVITCKRIVHEIWRVCVCVCIFYFFPFVHIPNVNQFKAIRLIHYILYFKWTKSVIFSSAWNLDISLANIVRRGAKCAIKRFYDINAKAMPTACCRNKQPLEIVTIQTRTAHFQQTLSLNEMSWISHICNSSK